MSKQSERDTHFKHFAELVVREMGRQHWIDDWYPDDWNSLTFPEHVDETTDSYEEAMVFIARCAYDFACYLLSNPVVLEREAPITASQVEAVIAAIPDMTAWPEWKE